MTDEIRKPLSDDSPRWKWMYAIVLGELALLVFLMWIFTKAFE